MATKNTEGSIFKSKEELYQRQGFFQTITGIEVNALLRRDIQFMRLQWSLIVIVPRVETLKEKLKDGQVVQANIRHQWAFILGFMCNIRLLKIFCR